MIRYSAHYRNILPERDGEYFLVLDQIRVEGEQYMQVLGRGEILHFRFNSLFMYEVVE